MKTRGDAVLQYLLPANAYTVIIEDLMLEAPKK